MGLMQRRKGRAFEQAIARQLRARWPEALVRRASQAERADNPDVFCEGGPRVLARLWLELQDARQPTPAKKIEQAENDAMRWQAHGHRALQPTRLPVVIWHRLAERSIQVTTRMWVLLDLVEPREGAMRSHQEVVTLELGEFLDIVARLP